MRRDAVFGDLVHFLGADLQFDALLAGPDHRGVDRAIVVLLRRRDVILEAAGHDRPGGVDDADRLIAFSHRVHDHAERENIGQLLEADRLALHLAPDRIGALLPALDLAAIPRSASLRVSCCSMSMIRSLLRSRERQQPLGHDIVGVRIELAERQVLELLAHLLHAHAAGERRIDIERLFRHPPPRLRRHVMQGAHVVQTVGELDEQNAHIVGDGEQQLAQILRLLGFLGDEVELLQLGQALDQHADLLAEQLVDLRARRRRILDGVVQERRGDGRVVELQVGQDRGDFERMRKIRVARGALLLAMRLHGIDIGAVEQRFVGIRIVAADPLDQFVLPHHLRLGRRASAFRCRGRHMQPKFQRRAGARLVLHPGQCAGSIAP